MITENQAVRLLHKYEVPVEIIYHCKAVAKTAMEIVDECKLKNVDKQKLKIACLLHDIGRVKVLRDGSNPEFGSNRHEPHSVEILKKEKLPEIAEIVSKHGYMLANYTLDELTIEEKVLAIADSLSKGDKRVSASPEEREKRFMKKYEAAKDYKALEQFKKSMPIYTKIIKEFGLK
ncbi:MAG: HD domain-containing protein [Candidatus Micrarchaeota archaeon]